MTKTIKIDDSTLKGDIEVTPRETTYFKTPEGEADILSNPQYPLTPGEIYSPEEAEAVRNGKLTVEDVVKAHEDEIYNNGEVVSKTDDVKFVDSTLEDKETKTK